MLVEEIVMLRASKDTLSDIGQRLKMSDTAVRMLCHACQEIEALITINTQTGVVSKVVVAK